MTTLQRSLNSVAFAAMTLFSLNALADSSYCPKAFPVLERDGGDGYRFESRQLEKLFCTNKFEGEHFKIVYSTEDEAISFDHSDPKVIQRAANVYHHLTRARDFWMKEIKSDYVSKLQQITIRIDITNAFSNLRHFKNAELEKNYNNAWTIPEGETPSFASEKKKWGKEIWFSPSKKIEARKNVKSEGKNPIHESLVLIKDPIVDWNTSALIYQGLGLLVTPEIDSSATLDLAIKRLGAIAVIYGLVEVTRHMDKWFMNRYYYVDTAMIPEIIYHEYAHIAMSDTMPTVHSVPVIEGMADYFATRIADRRKMYESIKDFSSNLAKDRDNDSWYHPYLEGSWNATSDFTLSMLWLGHKEFAIQNEKRIKKGQAPLANYDEIIHHAHFNMNENSDIANELTGALIKACNKVCSSKRAGVNTLHQVFEKKGMN